MEATSSAPAAGLHDENVTSYVDKLMDWDGSDLQKIRTPITQIIGYIFSAFFLLMVSYVIWAQIRDCVKRRRRGHVPYKVVKPPSSLVEAGKKPKGKRVCAVVGGTGFIGSHVVDELVRRGRHFVYVLGRDFDKEWDVNPEADACIQVDMMDFDGLVNALAGVETVIVASAVVPNAYLTVDDVWRGNKLGHENVRLAAEKAGVKAFVFVSGVEFEAIPAEPHASAFYKALLETQSAVARANRKGGMRTCVLAFSQVYGLRSGFYEPLLAGKITFPALGQHASFVPADYVARALVNAEEKLVAGDSCVCGKVLPLAGEPSAFKELLSLPAWGFKIWNMPLWVLSTMAYLNAFCGRRMKWAPLGADLSPGVMAFFSSTEKRVDCTESQKVLEVGQPPPLEEGIKQLVASYKAREAKGEK